MPAHVQLGEKDLPEVTRILADVGQALRELDSSLGKVKRDLGIIRRQKERLGAS